MVFVEAEKRGLSAVGALTAVGHFAPHSLGIEFERPFEIGYQDPNVSDAFNLNSHNELPP
jgi:hypothetical protein